MSTKKLMLGFDFDRINKTIWLEPEKQSLLLMMLHKWIWAGTRNRGILFNEIESVMAKVCHTFTALPVAVG